VVVVAGRLNCVGRGLNGMWGGWWANCGPATEGGRGEKGAGFGSLVGKLLAGGDGKGCEK